METRQDGAATARPNITAKSGVNVKGMRQVVEKLVSKHADTLPPPDETEQKQIEQMWQILESSEYQTFVGTMGQDLRSIYKETGVFDVSFQDFFDFFESQGMPRVDFAQASLQGFREYFPTGEPEDYETEMASRFQEIFLVTPGSRTEASLSTSMTLYAEPDFSAWLMGRFKGEIGQQVQWIEEQTAIAAVLENVPGDTYTERLTTPAPSVTDVELATPTPSTEAVRTSTSEPRHTPVGERPSVDAVNASVPLSVERIASVRETLRRYGTDEGIRHLLENESESIGWLLENFNSSEEIDAWLAESATEALPSKQQYPSKSPPFRTEVPPWTEVPE